MSQGLLAIVHIHEKAKGKRSHAWKPSISHCSCIEQAIGTRAVHRGTPTWARQGQAQAGLGQRCKPRMHGGLHPHKQ